MAVIVYNKNTGKYLRRRSGSYRDQRSNARYKVVPTAESRHQRKTTDKSAWQDWIADEIDRVIFSANPEDARVYASKGSALTSVGKYGGLGAKMTWPDRLEAHEIKEVSVCVIRPDGTSNCDEENSNGKSV